MFLRTGLAMLFLVAVLTAVQAHAAVLVDSVRTLAENVLGRGAVISVRASDDGAQVLMRWESATYNAAHRLAATREMMYGEAELATGSVMGQLHQVVRIRFTILKNNQMLATGENWRGRGVTMAFSTQLGGGVQKPRERVEVIDPTLRGGSSASEL